jgi:opacity protein-like surface antigen
MAMPARVAGGMASAAARRRRGPCRIPSIRKWSVLLFLLLVSSGPCLADVGRGDWEIGFDTMYIFLGTESFESNLDAGGRVGLRAGYYLTDHFQLEAQYSYSNSEGDCGLLLCSDIDTTLKTRFVNGVFRFDVEREFKPYLLVGIGQARLDFDGDIAIEDDSTAYQAGIGFRIDHRRLGARLELLATQDRTFDGRSTHVSFGVGLVFRPGSGP